MKALLAALALVACNRGDQVRNAPPPIEHAQPVAAAPATTVPAGPSIYELPIALRTAGDLSIELDVHRGKPVVISMFYASCTTACPVLLAEVARIVEELPAEIQADVRVLMVSFDPARDTPATLATLTRERKLDDRWTLAAASEPDARALAAVLGVKYRKLANGDFAHGSTIVALDRDGRPLARTDTLGDRSRVVAALSAR